MFEIPTQTTVVGPNDTETGVWMRTAADGRHALLIGDSVDGGVAYAGTIPELTEFADRISRAVQSAADREALAPGQELPSPSADVVAAVEGACDAIDLALALAREGAVEPLRRRLARAAEALAAAAELTQG